MTKSVTRLDDKYLQTGGRVFMSANQALVRLPLDQARRDRALSLTTTGYISGYRGSPLGVYDAALMGASQLLADHDIRFEPGLNEELAASAIRGTQQLNWFGKSRYQGAFGLWYGKGVGVDRACEALKLGNLEGTSQYGGFLALAGDDHGGKSSASAHQSEHTLIAGFLPILYPSTIREIIEFGLFGWALSRYSGLYVGLKCITDTLDISGSVELPDPHVRFAVPDLLLPPDGLSLRQNLPPLVLEELTVNHRLPAARAFVGANGLDRVTIHAPDLKLGIVSAGKAYLDLRQALDDLGLDEAECRRLGISVYKPGLIWPLEPVRLAAFSEGHRALLVVEEKRPVLEEQIAHLLYRLPVARRPELLGKRDLEGSALLPEVGELNAGLVRGAIRTALRQIDIQSAELDQRFAHFATVQQDLKGASGGSYRPPTFCSGCPHNTSTKLPDGSIAISAVGCHGLASYMPDRRTLAPMPMGGDGMPWVSAGPLVDRPHVFQNMGDGTYSHSGVLAIRAAVAARANMTFKILYNDAVAMTGGQPVEALLTPIGIVRQLQAEGVEPVILMSDAPGQYRDASDLGGMKVRHRDELDLVQRELRERKGVSAIVYEQTCATEKRRRRKRGEYPDPDQRIFINPAVCEDCGDCSVQSNCVSIQPLETELGRKRLVDQSTCNKDFSCVKGFCPSFVTVTGATIASQASVDGARYDSLIAALPVPPVAPIAAHNYNLLVAGIGGTGVLTVGALLGMAAHLEHKGCSVLDMTGMAQKGGAVTSHIRITDSPEHLRNARLGSAMTDVILACDLIVGSGNDILSTIKPGITSAIINRDVTPTSEFQRNRKLDLGEARLEKSVRDALRGGPLHALNATRLAVDLVGDSIATNLLIVGYAAQKGLLPVGIASIEEAIRLNGTFVKGNLRTFALGRLAAHQPQAFSEAPVTRPLVKAPQSLAEVLQHRSTLLTSYQNAAYAQGYVDFVQQIQQRVRARSSGELDQAVVEIALTLAKLMYYKDEYEVARLHADSRFEEQLRTQFSGSYRLQFHLAPPMLPGRDPSGRPRKRQFGGWMMHAFRILRHLKFLRGSPLDPFGYTHERRIERQLIAEYRALAEHVIEKLDATNLQPALELLAAAREIRGYGPVKEETIRRYRERLPILQATFEAPQGLAKRAA
ncbi:MAG TPA: indolepyruvate ferredoxin oxidoreductase family protein [Vicinamibacterales bacterium]|nr:indolepyruvate ferredoxin oxidoreductase family protein [Vicinamibacterales bacterium]